ncbi:MAG: hypothetical protein ACLTZY_13250 [Alistipes indistinctus]
MRDSDEFGKPVGGDILEGKKTFLLTNALARADEPARRSLLELLSDRTIVPAEKIARVRAIYDRLGIRELTEKAVAAYFVDANLALDALEVAPDRVDAVAGADCRIARTAEIARFTGLSAAPDG